MNTSSANSVNASTHSVPPPRAELLHVRMLPDFDRADRIGGFYGNPKTRTFAELLIRRQRKTRSFVRSYR